MIRKLTPLLAALPLLLASAASAADTTTLKVFIQGLQKPGGTYRGCVFVSPEGFPNCEKGQGVIIFSAPADASSVTIPVPGVPTGQKVAVSLFVDADNSKKLERGLMGIPKEPMGFSNNPTVSFGPPKFDAAAVTAGDEPVTIKLKYF